MNQADREIVFARTILNDDICWDQFRNPHLLVAGRPGAGKTTVLASIVRGLHFAARRVYVIDLFRSFADHRVPGIVTDLEDAIALVENLGETEVPTTLVVDDYHLLTRTGFTPDLSRLTSPSLKAQVRAQLQEDIDNERRRFERLTYLAALIRNTGAANVHLAIADENPTDFEMVRRCAVLALGPLSDARLLCTPDPPLIRFTDPAGCGLWEPLGLPAIPVKTVSPPRDRA